MKHAKPYPRAEIARKRFTTHGMSGTVLHRTWKGMRNRCRNRNSPDYADYGGRGISVCDRWDSFEAFYQDMGPSYSPGLTLDRIDNNGPYSPENCRWATRKQQLRNKRSNQMVEIDGVTLCMEDWLKKYGLSNGTYRSRIRRGWTPANAIITPPDTARRAHHFHTEHAMMLTIDGETLLVSDWARRYNIDRRTVYSRLRRGWNPEDAVKQP